MGTWNAEASCLGPRITPVLNKHLDNQSFLFCIRDVHTDSTDPRARVGLWTPLLRRVQMHPAGRLLVHLLQLDLLHVVGKPAAAALPPE